MTKPKKEIAPEKHGEKKGEKENSAGQDQREKKYYYDDAHGYEIYNPETDEESDEN